MWTLPTAAPSERPGPLRAPSNLPSDECHRRRTRPPDAGPDRDAPGARHRGLCRPYPWTLPTIRNGIHGPPESADEGMVRGSRNPPNTEMSPWTLRAAGVDFAVAGGPGFARLTKGLATVIPWTLPGQSNYPEQIFFQLALPAKSTATDSETDP